MNKEKDLQEKLDFLTKQVESLTKDKISTENKSELAILSDGEKIQRAKTKITMTANESYLKIQEVQKEYNRKNEGATSLYRKTFFDTKKAQQASSFSGKPYKGFLPSVAALKKVAKEFPNLISLTYPNHPENLEMKQEGGPTGITYTFYKGLDTFIDVRDFEEIKNKLGVSKQIIPNIQELQLVGNNEVLTKVYDDSNISTFGANAVNVAKEPAVAQKKFEQLTNNIKKYKKEF